MNCSVAIVPTDSEEKAVVGSVLRLTLCCSTALTFYQKNVSEKVNLTSVFSSLAATGGFHPLQLFHSLLPTGNQTNLIKFIVKVKNAFYSDTKDKVRPLLVK